MDLWIGHLHNNHSQEGRCKSTEVIVALYLTLVSHIPLAACNIFPLASAYCISFSQHSLKLCYPAWCAGAAKSTSPGSGKLGFQELK